jgi:DNA-binding NarL/FixJ family response regulator
MATSRIRVLLVDDHQVVRMGLAALFSTVPRVEVVGEAGNVAESIAEARRCHPDVVLMDVRLPDGSGVEACREIRSERPETAVIMLTSYNDEDAVIAAILAGAAGYLLKGTNPARLIEAVDAVARGESLLDATATQVALTWLRRLATPAPAPAGSDVAPPADQLTSLSEQERRILPLIAAGKTNRQIAGILFLSESTVKTYVSNILQKLHVASRAQAAAYIARRQRLPGPSGRWG